MSDKSVAEKADRSIQLFRRNPQAFSERPHNASSIQDTPGFKRRSIMAVFSFTLDSFQITDTRSLHEDTDYVTFTLLVKAKDGSGTPRTLMKSMGDVNNGVHTVNLSFTNVQVNPTDTVVLNYLIVNSGHKNPSQVTSTLEGAATKLATQGGTLLGNAIAPGIGGSLVGAAAGVADQPFSGNPTFLFELVQRGVQRAGADLQHLFRHLFEALGKGPSVHRL